MRIDSSALVKVARTAGCTLRLEAALGDFVPAGGPLVTVEGDPAELPDDDVRRGIELALERSLDQDVAYGFRMLVDIAERSLADSPFQDPTTAVQAIDRLHDGLRQLARRPFPSPEHRDEEGDLRLLVPVMGWDAYVELAFAELRRAGADVAAGSRDGSRLRCTISSLSSPPSVPRCSRTSCPVSAHSPWRASRSIVTSRRPPRLTPWASVGGDSVELVTGTAWPGTVIGHSAEGLASPSRRA